MLSAVDCLASRCAARHVRFTAGGTKSSELYGLLPLTGHSELGRLCKQTLRLTGMCWVLSVLTLQYWKLAVKVSGGVAMSIGDCESQFFARKENVLRVLNL